MTIPPVGAAPPPATGATAPRAGFAAALDGRAGSPVPARAVAAGPPHPAAVASASALAPIGATGPWMPALASVARAQARLDRVLAQARAGKTFTAAELLALQAEAYRCAQVVDLGAKLAEQGAQSVKQALNAQV